MYIALENKFEKLDKRNKHYQFDIETDIPWLRLGESGEHIPMDYLDDLGFDCKVLAKYPEANSLFQWAAAIEFCRYAAGLEMLVINFLERVSPELLVRESNTTLCDEERKHIDLFDRYLHFLKRQRNGAMFTRLDKLIGNSYVYDFSYGLVDLAGQHCVFWLFALLVEEHTIYFHERLAEAREPIQPVWLAAHEAHRREETQHVVTDCAHLEALNLEPARREQLATMMFFGVELYFNTMFRFEASTRLLHEQFPKLPPIRRKLSLRDSGLFRDFCRHRKFKRSREHIPALNR
jgi:hypothetical protein